MSAPGITIRPAVPGDAAAVAALADRLRLVLGDPTGHLTPGRILADGFGERPEFSLLVAERAGDVVGYALFTEAYEPAYAARGLYLADLYVNEDARGMGAGRSLVEAVGKVALARGRSFVWWVAQERNTEALAFYRRLAPDFCSPVVAHALMVGGA